MGYTDSQYDGYEPRTSLRVYVASSWRNPKQQEVIRILLDAGLEVYDFRNPAQGNYGFYSWEMIDPNWKSWSPDQFRKILDNWRCNEAFALDFNAMSWADLCVLVLPCNRSAHLEAGWFVGKGKPLFILLDSGEPELTYKMANGLFLSYQELLDAIRKLASERGRASKKLA